MPLKSDIISSFSSALVLLDFPAMQWDKNTKQPSPTGTTVKVDSFSINEVSANFKVDAAATRGETQYKKENWVIEVRLRFKVEVDLGVFEDQFCTRLNPLASPSMTGVIALEPTSMKVEHPTRQDAHAGTTAIYSFKVNFLRQRKV